MKHTIQPPSLLFIKESLIGERIQKSCRVLADLEAVFSDKDAYKKESPDTLIYEVSSHLSCEEGTPGGLYFGITKIYPGKIGNEYYMTKGHYHANRDREEYYWGISGEGVLILMDEKRNIRTEKVFPGSLHHIPGGMAHRVANIGNTVLSFAACWPSDAGHNYEEIADNGFSASLQCINGNPQLV